MSGTPDCSASLEVDHQKLIIVPLEAHPCVAKARPGIVEDHPGAKKAQPGAAEVHNEAVKVHPGAVEAHLSFGSHPTATEAHPAAI
jgi:hypothetical protein